MSPKRRSGNVASQTRKGSKPRIIIGFCIFCMIVSLFNCGGNKDQQATESISKKETTEQSEETKASEELTKQEDGPEATSEPEPGPESEYAYMDNKPLEIFFETYNALSNSPMTDIEQGNIDTKYDAHSYNTWLEVLYPTGGGLDVTITATNDNDNRNVFSEDMRCAFHDVVKALNADISDDTIAAAWDGAVGGELMGSMENVSYSFFTHSGVGGNRIDLAREPIVSDSLNQPSGVGLYQPN